MKTLIKIEEKQFTVQEALQFVDKLKNMLKQYLPTFDGRTSE
jgi:hypothetical protein